MMSLMIGKANWKEFASSRMVNSIFILLILVLAVIVLLPASPFLYQMPGTDSSIFLYIGQKIRLGQFPYLHWYDHKPPLIFYLNALGLAFGNGSRWGVWALEFASLLCAALLGFFFLRCYFGKFAAFGAVAITLLHFSFVYERGNLTEEYALPFQFAALFLLGKIERGEKPVWRLIGIGSMLAIASSLKQPLAGIGVSIFAYLALTYLLRNDLRGLLSAGLLVGLGFVVIWAAWFAYFFLSGIFADFWEAAFQYNVALSGIPIGKRISALLDSLEKWGGNSGYFLGGMIAWLTLLPYLIFKDDRLLRFSANRWLGAGLAGAGLVVLGKSMLSLAAPQDASTWIFLGLGLILLVLSGLVLSGKVEAWTQPVLAARQPERRSSQFLPLLIALVDLPVVILLSSLSGNNYNHYFMAMLPSLTILMAYTIPLVRQGVSSRNNRAMVSIWMIILVLAVLIPGIQYTWREYKVMTDRQVQETVAYINQNTLPGDYVLQWGVSPQVNLLSGRDSPTRFFFADPLFVAGYSGKMQSDLLLSELQARPPVLIINSEIVRLPLIFAADPSLCGTVRDPETYYTVLGKREKDKSLIPQMPEGMGEVYYWICQNYTRVAEVGELQWDVYRLKGK